MYLSNTPYSNKSLYLDTKNATYSNGYYQFELESYIQAPPMTKMLLTVKEAQLVNVFPNIRTGINDTINITGSISGNLVYTIPEGYYDVNQFQSTFDGLSTTLGSDIAVTYSTSTLKLTFTSSTEDFTIHSSSTADYIGLNGDITSTGGIVLMPLIMDFSSFDYIFIKSNLHLRNINNLGLTSNTLMRFPLTLPYGYTNSYQPPQPTKHLSHETSLGFIQIFISDKEGRDLNLQNTNLQVTIEISYLYPPEERNYVNVRQTHPWEQEIKQNNKKENDDKEEK
jgi:hypothetical protein